MPRLFTRTSAVLVALALAFPAAGLAQGAGDEQYSDPFAEGQGGGGNSGSGNSGSDNSGSGNSGSGNSGSTGSGSSTPSQPQSGTTAQTPQTTTPQTTQGGEQLPRTGYPAWLGALAGGVLLASGATLRVSLGLRR